MHPILNIHFSQPVKGNLTSLVILYFLTQFLYLASKALPSLAFPTISQASPLQLLLLSSPYASYFKMCKHS